MVGRESFSFFSWMYCVLTLPAWSRKSSTTRVTFCRKSSAGKVATTIFVRNLRSSQSTRCHCRKDTSANNSLSTSATSPDTLALSGKRSQKVSGLTLTCDGMRGLRAFRRRLVFSCVWQRHPNACKEEDFKM